MTINGDGHIPVFTPFLWVSLGTAGCVGQVTKLGVVVCFTKKVRAGLDYIVRFWVG